MPHHASTPAIHTQGSLRGGVPPPQRGVWGKPPPDPGSVHTNKNRKPQVFTVYRLACAKDIPLVETIFTKEQ
jgi:hypothetical protein